MYIKLLLLSCLCFLVSEMTITRSYAARSTYNKEIAKLVEECEEKLGAVCNHEHLFVTPMAEHERKKKYYLKLLNAFRGWVDQSKIILHTLQHDEVQQNVSDFTQTCEDYHRKISDFLFWVEGKTPPEGFSMAKPDDYFKAEIQRD